MKILLSATLVLGMATSLLTQNKHSLIIKNASSFERKEVVSIPYEKFKNHFGLKDTIFTILDQGTKKPLVFQLEKLGKSIPQNVLIAIQIAPQGKLELAVSADSPPKAVVQTFARYVPERKDDFAWENNVVAFRAYGKALEGTSEDAQGFDFWSKRTDELIINEWYKTGDYHADHGKGLDYYSVGQTLGVGDMALYFDDQIQYSKHYRRYEVLDNGPIRSTFKLIYEPQEINGHGITIEKIVSLDAESQLNKVTLSVKNMNATSTPIVIGLAKRNEQNPNWTINKKANYFAYWEPEQNGNSTGTALLFPTGLTTFIDTPTQFLWKTTVKNNQSLTYYTGAAFNKASKIQSMDAWKEYLQKTAKQIQKPLIISYKK
ncbi:DUF4861 domain-containing protein [Sphingobacterium sp. SRCM116780]|uniref:DUF4861 family protein n=1 Tax=Sphingobacterium sp. SRCM116780 TaxID=2907623 RepID=UPI001F4870C7|nr:DUF4861 family protein [Sphingobacterium sp. SRCM116780]UIR55724.1 DUF4861 domain-containing protein [Sphingobacterium sp. SRCM116780]